MDHTRFKTLQKGIEVATDLEIPEEQRLIKGESFRLSLLVTLPDGSDVEKPLDIIVDRIPSDMSEGVHTFANGDLAIETIARWELDGPTFKISILLELELMRDNGANVYVSKDMERIILAQLGRDLDQLLREGTEM